jgi:hypothetical protein
MVTTTPVRVSTSRFGPFASPYPLPLDLAIYRLAHATHVAMAIFLPFLSLFTLGVRRFTPFSSAIKRSSECGGSQRGEGGLYDGLAIRRDEPHRTQIPNFFVTCTMF